MARKDVNSMSSADLNQLGALLDQYISKPTDNPVTEHRNAGHTIHHKGFLAWHQHFIAKLEFWLVLNGGGKFVPLPYWNPAKSIPPELNNNNNAVNLPLPSNLRPMALRKIKRYSILNTRILPYHNEVHNNMGGNMPDPDNSPSDPIFWPFHSFLLAVYERWRNQRTKNKPI